MSVWLCNILYVYEWRTDWLTEPASKWMTTERLAAILTDCLSFRQPVVARRPYCEGPHFSDHIFCCCLTAFKVYFYMIFIYISWGRWNLYLFFFGGGGGNSFEEEICNYFDFFLIRLKLFYIKDGIEKTPKIMQLFLEIMKKFWFLWRF